jgi:hypothetical protein
MVSLCSGATASLKKYDVSATSDGFRFEVLDYADFLISKKPEIHPEYQKGIIFHSCPKCGNSAVFKNFISYLYRNSESIPVFTSDYCGATELLDRSVPGIRSEITKSFCEKNELDNFGLIACSSFECMEYLNDFFPENNMKIRAVHFIDSVKA